MDELISRKAAIDALEEPREVSDSWTDEYAVGERMQWEKDVKALNSLPSAQPDIVEKILAAGKEGKEVRIYIGGRLFGVRELAQ